MDTYDKDKRCGGAIHLIPTTASVRTLQLQWYARDRLARALFNSILLLNYLKASHVLKRRARRKCLQAVSATPHRTWRSKTHTQESHHHGWVLSFDLALPVGSMLKAQSFEHVRLLLLVVCVCLCAAQRLDRVAAIH